MKQPALRDGYWRDTPLDRMSGTEWEALCDGCGKCCLVKLEEDDGQVFYTDVACRLFDAGTCRCGNYPLRETLVPECVILTPATVRRTVEWMPRTCAYRLIAEGKALPEWHYLVCGDREAVHRAGISARGWTVPEYEVPEDELEDHIIDDEI